MHKGRVEAFSDGVIAILITILVLELHAPHGDDWHALQTFLPLFGIYLMSFVFVGIYWNNHHHMFQLVRHVTGGILWANLHLLFWLSIVPISTLWLSESHLAPLPTAVYGVILCMCGVAYTVLQRAVIASQGEHSELAAAVGDDRKGLASLFLYATSIPTAFVRPWISAAIFVTVAILWLVPDTRIEKRVTPVHHD